LPFDLLTYTAAGGQSLANKLRSLSSEGFVQLLSAIFRIVQVNELLIRIPFSYLWQSSWAKFEAYLVPLNNLYVGLYSLCPDCVIIFMTCDFVLNGCTSNTNSLLGTIC
jgi:hypothetical protein